MKNEKKYWKNIEHLKNSKFHGEFSVFSYCPVVFSIRWLVFRDVFFTKFLLKNDKF